MDNPGNIVKYPLLTRLYPDNTNQSNSVLNNNEGERVKHTVTTIMHYLKYSVGISLKYNSIMSYIKRSVLIYT